MKLRKAFGDKIFPHVLAEGQWVLLIMILALRMNPSIIVTGATANGGLKVILLFPLLVLLFSAVLSLLLYNKRKDGITERCALGLSLITVLFSLTNILLHFANDLVLFTKATEVMAWVFYNSSVAVSIYKISVVFLLPTLRRIVEVEDEKVRNDKKSWA